MLEVVEQANFMAKAFGGDDPEGLSERARELAGNFDGEGSGGYNLALSLKNAADAFKSLFDALDSPGADGANSTLQNFADGINAIADAMRFLGRAYDTAKPVLKYIGGVNFVRTAIETWSNRLDPAKAAGGSVMANRPYTVGEFGPETFVPNGSGSIRPNGGLGGGVTIIMNGVIDGESARRSIEKLLQDSSRRTGAVNLVGATL
jgi:SLT domain-containing protein